MQVAPVGCHFAFREHRVDASRGQMPSYLDLGLIAVILISALLAMLRGFTREILAIASWIAAAAAAAYLYPYLLPYVKPYLAKEPWSSIASATAIFFVALILVSIITINISDAILDSKVGALDRSLGFLFGAARGFVLCVIAFVFFSMLSPADKQPEWVRNARMRPLLQSVGDDMTAMLPHDLLNKFIKPKAATPPEGDTPGSDKPDPDQNSPAPLPPERNDGGKQP
jgi:membrane protein required for colicin V production